LVYIEEHPDATLAEASEVMGLNASTIHRRLKDLKITRKKKRHFIEKQILKKDRNLLRL